MVTVTALVDVTANVHGDSKRLTAGQRYELPADVASELARAGYVELATTAERETAINPVAAKRSTRKAK